MDDLFWKKTIWQQFGAAIDMLENAMAACPESLWGDRTRQPEFWYTTFHTLFWLDLYLSDSKEGFTPPAPFILSELDPDGFPDRVYTKEELQSYLLHCRAKCRTTIAALSEDKAQQPSGFERLGVSVAELLLYNLRHVQHHTGQLNTLLRQATGAAAPRWVRVSLESL
jgi:DinB superfamily